MISALFPDGAILTVEDDVPLDPQIPWWVPLPHPRAGFYAVSVVLAYDRYEGAGPMCARHVVARLTAMDPPAGGAPESVPQDRRVGDWVVLHLPGKPAEVVMPSTAYRWAGLIHPGQVLADTTQTARWLHLTRVYQVVLPSHNTVRRGPTHAMVAAYPAGDAAAIDETPAVTESPAAAPSVTKSPAVEEVKREPSPGKPRRWKYSSREKETE